jgi:ABC-type amino acid transport substrate-binding protein
MAHMLARDLGVKPEFVPVNRQELTAALARGTCDLVMSGFAVTPERAVDTLLSATYLDETLAFIVLDNRREEFADWSSIRKQDGLRVGVRNLPYYIDNVKRALPRAEIIPFESAAEMFGPQAKQLDAILFSAERGSAWTLLHPELSVVVPTSRHVKVPLAYPLASDPAFARFVDTWIELKRKGGTIETLYEYWILGRHPSLRKPRWSVIRNVLHWVD